jgi:hypothetical protein
VARNGNRTAIAPIDYRARGELVAWTHEARECLAREQGPRNEQARLTLSVSIVRRDGDRHQAKGREVVGKLCLSNAVALLVGDD